jgi:peptide/nickel transport system permease protein
MATSTTVVLDEPPEYPDAEEAGDLGARRRRLQYLRTILLYAVTLWAVVTLVFLLPRLIPGDPLRRFDDPESAGFVYDASSRAKVAAYYGLDRPLLDQYRSYVSGIAHGDFGWSISQNQPVGRLMRQRMPWTLLLTGGALMVSSAISFFAGVTAAWNRNRLGDRALIVALSAARAIPEYAIGTALLITFAVTYHVFPQAGARTAFAEYGSTWEAVNDVAAHLVLPLTSLALGLTANKFLIVRNTVIGTLGEDYMLLARAKGLSRRVLKYRHSARNALLPFVTALGVQAAFAVGGSLLVETVFSYPGMGTLIDRAVTGRDYPLLQGCFIVLAVVVLIANLLVELVYTRLDPRVVQSG